MAAFPSSPECLWSPRLLVFLWALLLTPARKGTAAQTPSEILQQILKSSKSLNGRLQTTQDCKPALPINKTWKCSRRVLSFKFRLSLWSVDLQNHAATRRDAAEGVWQMLFWRNDFALVLCSAAACYCYPDKLNFCFLAINLKFARVVLPCKWK